MAIKPVVRYMLPCDDWRTEADTRHRLTIIGLISAIEPVDDPPYPCMLDEMCVVLLLTAGRGEGAAKIVCVQEETGLTAFESGSHRIAFPADPLAIVGVPFRILNCPFPDSGLYSVQFWYEGEMVEERSVRVR